MVVGFTTTYAVSAYHHQRCEFEPLSWRDVFDTTLLEFNFEIQYKPDEQLIVPDSLSRGFGFMVFNATFNNISVISWRSVLLVEETGVSEKTAYLSHVDIFQNQSCFYSYISPLLDVSTAR
jgi:hypothetical protein